jgi:hypothetical protein
MAVVHCHGGRDDRGEEEAAACLFADGLHEARYGVMQDLGEDGCTENQCKLCEVS